MDAKEETKKYSTKSLDSAAVVMALGAKIVGVKREPADDKFLTFVFEATFDMEKVAFEHSARTLVANTYDILEANKRMKSIIHSAPPRQYVTEL